MNPNARDEPLVCVIILSWNQRDLTLACLESLTALDYPAQRIEKVVVDNGSIDGTLRAIQARYQDVMILKTGDNLGYGGGNNFGIQYALRAGSEYTLIVNSDVLLAPDALTQLVSVAKRSHNAACLGPKVYHREAPHHIQSAGILLDRRFRSHHRGRDQIDAGQFDEVVEVDAVIGCTMLLSRQALEVVGMLDTRYFMYREEIDWCCRARSKGFRVLYVPAAKVWHRNPDTSDTALPRITYYMTRNSYLLLRTQHASIATIAHTTAQNLLWLVNWTISPKWRHKKEQRDSLFKGLVDALLGRYGRRPHRYGA
jgi:GT2 family glycosyltransferase